MWIELWTLSDEDLDEYAAMLERSRRAVKDEMLDVQAERERREGERTGLLTEQEKAALQRLRPAGMPSGEGFGRIGG